jgi:hypothetical protein
MRCLWRLIRFGCCSGLFVMLWACGGGSSGSGSDGARSLSGAETPPCDADTSALVSRIYVDSRSDLTQGCGLSMVTACQTIQQGIAACGDTGCGVLVRHGLYPTSATIELRQGVNVYGGCRFNGEADLGYRTMIQAAPPPGSPALRASGIDAPTGVHGLAVFGKNETAAGSPSIALLVSDSKGLVLTDSSLVGGRGGDGGMASESPIGGHGGDGSPAPARYTGGAGGLACPSQPPADGAGTGGRGADSNLLYTEHRGLLNAYCWSVNQGGIGPNGQTGAPSGRALGGPGGPPGTPGCICVGAPINVAGIAPQAGSGDPGRCGATAPSLADPWGTLSRAGWSPNRGSKGLPGDVGAGGGGGGGGGYSAGETNETDLSGYAGGGGGGGGCGGPGGAGGLQGGASIVVVLAGASAIDLGQRNRFIGGPGGLGGQGALGGQGGPGGSGQAGRAGFDQFQPYCNEKTAAPGTGGRGGDGGPGGSGSGGSGGNGGPSIGIARVAGAAVPASVPDLYPGMPGDPGHGGTVAKLSACPSGTGTGSDGRPGGVATIVDFDALPVGGANHLRSTP